MKKILLASVLSFALPSIALAVDIVPPSSTDKVVMIEPSAGGGAVEDEHHEAPAHKWGYNAKNGAATWDGLCKMGKKQSPINIVRFLQEDQPDLSMTYEDGPLTVENNGHTVVVKFAAGSNIVLDGVNYELAQANFHTPSEHYLDGAPYPMEAHLVHKNAQGAHAVIGVMMKVGAHNPVIEGIWQNVPANGATKSVDGVMINAVQLLPENKAYYAYEGSLTTPPCSEGVRWHVMQDAIELSESQLRAFQSVFPVNARPVQPLNGRVVTGD
ncbi:MAG: carbonic anhydrase family protein [Micavibrio sp.]|nr:carbonic anhydrase family protein [Micavibrio sp.]